MWKKLKNFINRVHRHLSRSLWNTSPPSRFLLRRSPLTFQRYDATRPTPFMCARRNTAKTVSSIISTCYIYVLFNGNDETTFGNADAQEVFELNNPARFANTVINAFGFAISLVCFVQIIHKQTIWTRARGSDNSSLYHLYIIRTKYRKYKNILLLIRFSVQTSDRITIFKRLFSIFIPFRVFFSFSVAFYFIFFFNWLLWKIYY